MRPAETFDVSRKTHANLVGSGGVGSIAGIGVVGSRTGAGGFGSASGGIGKGWDGGEGSGFSGSLGCVGISSGRSPGRHASFSESRLTLMTFLLFEETGAWQRALLFPSASSYSFSSDSELSSVLDESDWLSPRRISVTSLPDSAASDSMPVAVPTAEPVGHVLTASFA